MLLTLSTTHHPAQDLGYLLHKHPDRLQSFALSFGAAHVFYPRCTPEQCDCCLLLDVDPVSMVRRPSPNQQTLLDDYVNDRPYVASSFLSVALAQVFGSAMNGNCKDRPALAQTPIPLSAQIDVLPVRGQASLINRLFEPLLYTVETQRLALDDEFPTWGESRYYRVMLSAQVTLSQLLSHLYVLIPVFDNAKHYFVNDAEIQKLLSKGEGWLASHPEKELISRRYLKNQSSLYRPALKQLLQDQPPVDDAVAPDDHEMEIELEKPLSLNDQRHGTVLSAVKASGARRVLDLGCGEGRFLRLLSKEKQFEKIVGMDVSVRALEIAHQRLKLDQIPERQEGRITLRHGSLFYRDARLNHFDAATLIEVIEHLDPARLAACERTVFGHAQPNTVLVTTPNREYNPVWETLAAGQFRHADHRFEWNRQEFSQWADQVAERFGYSVRFLPIGPVHPTHGPPTQMAVFDRIGDSE